MKKKNKVIININTNDKSNFSEYILECKSKSKKIIEKIENIENLKKIVNENKNQKINKNIRKKVYKKKIYKKKYNIKKN